MLLGFNTATTMTTPLDTDIRAVGQAGYDVIEITATKLDKLLQTYSLADVRKMIDAARLKTFAINSIERINSRDALGRGELLARTRELSRFAHALACPWIVVVPGPAPADTKWATIRDNTVNALRAMSDMAVSFNVNLAFEFLGFPWCSVRTVTQSWEIVQAVNRVNVGFVIDTCHFYAGDSTLASIRAVDAKKFAIFHINDVEAMPKEKIEDANRLFPGDGVIPLQDIIGAVRATGFDGVASIEIFRPEYWQRDPFAVAKEAKEKAEKILNRQSLS